MNTLKKTGLFYWWVSVLVFMLDWGTKGLAQTYLDPYIEVPIAPSFNLTLAYNTGAAFSLLNTGEFWPNILFGLIAITVSVLLLVWLFRLPREDRLLSCGLALVLGGALGNLWDRLRYHHVIDFIQLYLSDWHFPVFNLADAAVSLGALLVIWHWLREKK